jgi:hypothetical protein
MRSLVAGRNTVTLAFFACLVFRVGGTALGQKVLGSASQSPSTSPTSGASQSGGNSSSGGSALPGISYTRHSWKQIEFLPAPQTFGMRNTLWWHDSISSHLDYFSKDTLRRNVTIFCYTLKPNPTAIQPFTLEPYPFNVSKAGKELCANAEAHPKSLLMNRFLVFRIDLSHLSHVMRDRIQTVNLNITNQSGTSLNSQRGPTINPTPTGTSLASLSPQRYQNCDDSSDKQLMEKFDVAGKPLRHALCDYDPDTLYLMWPVELVGDTVPTVSINFIYTPVAPAQPWQKKTFYPAGSVIVSDTHAHTNGHYYIADSSGISSNTSPSFGSGSAVEVLTEGNGSSGLSWMDMGYVTVTPTPPAWQAHTPYSFGSLVVPPAPGNGHYYKAINAGTSGPTSPPFPVDGTCVADMSVPTATCISKKKGELIWMDMGYFTVNPAPSIWAPNTTYASGALVTPPGGNGHYYRAMTAGVTGQTAPAFPVHFHAIVRESFGVTWVDVGTAMPANTKLRVWTPKTAYQLGDTIQDQYSGHYYSVAQPGISGWVVPSFRISAPQIVTEGSIRWRDLGTTLPASVSAATQPSDQTVNALNLTYPQIQVLGRFNLAAGVVVSSLAPPSITSYAYPSLSTSSTTGAPPGPNSPCPTSTSTSTSSADPPVTTTTITSAACTVYTQTHGGHLVDPVLGVTVYAIRPLDAERSFKPSDLLPAPTFDISMVSPTSNYHVGFSSEFLMRNLQLVYGASFVQETRLAQPIANFNGQPISLSTSKKEHYGGFVGFSFNITGFVQSLFP